MKQSLSLNVKIILCTVLIWPIALNTAAKFGQGYVPAPTTHADIASPAVAPTATPAYTQQLRRLLQAKNMLLTNVMNDINFWLEQLGKRTPTADEIAQHVEQSMKYEISTLEQENKRISAEYPDAPTSALVSPKERAALKTAATTYAPHAQAITQYKAA